MLEENPESFCAIPEKHRSPELCMEAVKRWGYNLEFVPEGMKTKEMCRIALKASPDLGYEDGQILAHVPFSDICLEAIKDFEGGVDILEIAYTLRKEVINQEIADFLIEKDGCCLACLPLQLQTEELALKAVEVSGNSALLNTNIWDKVKTERVYLKGLTESHFQSFLVIPENRRTAEIYLMAEKLYPKQFRERPEIVPESIMSGCNVYTLNKALEKITHQQFTISQIKAVFNGGGICVGDREIFFDKNEKKIRSNSLKQNKRPRLKI